MAYPSIKSLLTSFARSKLDKNSKNGNRVSTKTLTVFEKFLTSFKSDLKWLLYDKSFQPLGLFVVNVLLEKGMYYAR